NAAPRARAYLPSPGDQRGLAEVVELHDRAAAVRAVDAGAAPDVEHARVADAALPAGRRRGRGPRALRGRGVEALAHRERREDEPLRAHVAGLRRVQPPQLEPMPAH